MIVEYKLNIREDGRKITPPWVECGGFIQNPESFTFMGFSPEKREYKIPDSVNKMTEAEAKSRALEIHQANPFFNEAGEEMEPEEVEEMTASIILSNDIK